MKKSNLMKSLLLSGVIMATSAMSVFASAPVDPSFTRSELVETFTAIPSTKVLYSVNTPTQDKFIIQENRLSKDENQKVSGYELYHRIDNKNNRIDFKLIADKGTTLGKLENSLGIYQAKKLEDGRTEYTFHYSLFGYEKVRIININVSDK